MNSSNLNNVEASKAKDANMVKSKDPQMREAIWCQLEGESDKYLIILELTVTRTIMRLISIEHQIVTSELHENSELGRKFIKCELSCMSKPLEAYK